MADPAFVGELERLHRTYTGRPSIITEVPRFAEHAGGARVFLKREDLNHTGSHKINNVLGQALLTKRMGKTRVIAETGAGQHGVATATAAALFGLECTVYMGEVDTERQALNVARMRLLGAEVIPVDDRLAHAQGRDQRGLARLGRQRRRHPLHLRHRRRAAPVPGDGARLPQDHRRRGPRAAPRARRPAARRRRSRASAAAPTRWASSTRSSTTPASGSSASRPAGEGVASGRHAARIRGGSPGVLHGAVHLRAAGRGRPDHRVPLDLGRPRLPGRRPRARLAARDRARRVPPGHRRRGDGGVPPAVPDRGHHPGDRVRARPGRRACERRAGELGRDAVLLVNLSGRGDKDMDTAARGSTCIDGEAPAEEPRRQGDAAECRRERPRHRRGVPSAEGRARPRRLPARSASPTVDGSIDGDAADRRGRRRHRRARAALHRPGHGRPRHPARRRGAPSPAASASATSSRPVARSPTRGAPVLVMTYWNPVLQYGVDALRRTTCAAAGGAGLITPDLIPDEAAEWIAASDAHGLDRVFLVAPSSTAERLAQRDVAAAAASSTPPRRWASPASGRRSAPRPRRSSPAPATAPTCRVCVGLGISNGEQAAEVARVRRRRDRRLGPRARARDGGHSATRASTGSRGPRRRPRRRCPPQSRRGWRRSVMLTAAARSQHPEPARPGVWHLGPLPVRAYALVHPRRDRRRGLDDPAAARQARRRSRAWSSTSRAWAVPVRHHRRPDLPRDHLARRPTSARAANPCERVPSGRAASGSGAPSPSARSAPGSAAARRHPLLDFVRRARPRPARRAGDRPLRQLVQPGALRRADRPAVGPARSTSGTRRRARRRRRRRQPGRAGLFHPTFLYEVSGTSLLAALLIWLGPPVPTSAGAGLRALRRLVHHRARRRSSHPHRPERTHPRAAHQRLGRRSSVSCSGIVVASSVSGADGHPGPAGARRPALMEPATGQADRRTFATDFVPRMIGRLTATDSLSPHVADARRAATDADRHA